MNGYRFRGQRLTDDINPYLPIMQKGGFLGMRRYNEPGLKGRTRGRQSSIDFNDKGLSMHGNAKIRYYGNPVSRSSQGSMSYQPLLTTSKPVNTSISERGYSTDRDEAFWKSEEGQRLMKDWNIPVGQQQSASSSQSMPRDRYGRIIFNPYIPRQISLSSNKQENQTSQPVSSQIVRQQYTDFYGNQRPETIKFQYQDDNELVFPSNETLNETFYRNNNYQNKEITDQDVLLRSDMFTIDNQAEPVTKPLKQMPGLNPIPELDEGLSRDLDFSLKSAVPSMENSVDDFIQQRRDAMRYNPSYGLQPTAVMAKPVLPPILSQPVAGQRPTVTPIKMRCGGTKKQAQAGSEISKLMNSRGNDNGFSPIGQLEMRMQNGIATTNDIVRYNKIKEQEKFYNWLWQQYNQNYQGLY